MGRLSLDLDKFGESDALRISADLGDYLGKEISKLVLPLQLSDIVQYWQVIPEGEIYESGNEVRFGNGDFLLTAVPRINEVTIQPGIGMIALFKTQNYTHWAALAEMVDNSIQSYLENKKALKALEGSNFKLKVEIDFGKTPSPTITVIDNAGGIAHKDVERAFTPAVAKDDLSGLSQFGIGMKSSATWMSNKYTITSTALGESVKRSVTFDVDKVLAEKLLALPISVVPASANAHGTTILMENLDKGVPEGQTLGKVRSYISSIYRDFLRTREIDISVGSKSLSFDDAKLLSEPFWAQDGVRPNPEDPNNPIKFWKRTFSFSLNESWESDPRKDKPKSPPEVHGWYGLLEQGTTKASGLALIWRRKVVVGAGTAAQADEDSYRPRAIFGTSNTFTFQRLVGEVDISELRVTTTKDNVLWQSGQEEEFQRKLREDLDANHFLRMARNYRSTESTKEIDKKVEAAASSAAKASTEALISSLLESEYPSDMFVAETLFSREEIFGTTEASCLVYRDSQNSKSYFLEVVSNENQGPLITLREADDGNFVISVNRNNVFIQSFADLPGADLDPVLRMAIAAALTQIKMKTLDAEGWHLLLPTFNQVLTDWLFRRMGNS